VPKSIAMFERGVWWELMAACARVAPGKEVHELDSIEIGEIEPSLHWPLRIYKEAVARAIERNESHPDAVARAEIFRGDLPDC
jgi:hypothetical protein